jgi:hypothetical protein
VALRVNGASSSQRAIALSELRNGSVIEVDLESEDLGNGSLSELNIQDPYIISDSERRTYLAAQTPYISSVTAIPSGLQLALDARGATNTEWDIWRNGSLISKGFVGNSYLDTQSGVTFAQRCYVAVQRISGTALNSEPSAETCAFVGNRASYDSKPEGVSGVGRLGVSLNKNQGAESVTYVPYSTGTYALVLEYSNSYNDVSTGITAATKWVEVIRASDGQLVQKGMITMPHLPRWDVKGVSSSLKVQMQAGEKYLVSFSEYFNMTNLSHYSLYDGAGGKDGPLNSASVQDVFISPLEN